MSTSVEKLIQFRCNKCWQPNYASVDKANMSVACEFCAAPLEVPAATSDRLLDSSQTVPPSASAVAEPQLENYSDAELQTLVEQQNYTDVAERHFAGNPNASHMSRFMAFVFDTIVYCVATAIGVVALFGAISYQVLPGNPETWNEAENLNAMLIAGCPLLMASVAQWLMTACWGKTVGKLLTFTRIVTCEGKVPGVFRGVLLRSWLNALISAFIPFYGIIDILFIFGNSQRCLHDYIAGTRVVQD